MNTHYILECTACNSYKIISEKIDAKNVSCGCSNKNIMIFGLFNDGKIFKYSLKN